MVRKNNLTIVLIIFISLIIIGTLIYFSFKGDIKIFQEESFTGGCQFIDNPADPKSEYTSIISTSRFTCGDPTSPSPLDRASECIIDGWMKLDKSRQINGERCAEPNSAGGWCLRLDDGSLRCANRNFCIGATLTIYDGYFDFTPAGQVAYAVASKGEKRYVSGSSPAGYSTTLYADEFKLNKGDSVEFTPKYGDLSSIPNNINLKKLRIKACDATCVQKVASGEACDPNFKKDVLCMPAKGKCPDKYQLRTSDSVGCYYSLGKVGKVNFYPTASDPICYSGVFEDNNCVRPEFEASGYKICSTNKDVDGCFKWSDATLKASSGQQCFIGGQLATDIGVGELKCSAQNECALFDKEPYPDGAKNEYRECVNSSQQCPVWSSKKICNPIELEFNANTDQCVCPSVLGGSSGDTKCIAEGGKNLLIYDTIKIGSLECPSVKTESLPINSERICKNGDFTCEGVDKCKKDEIQCTSLTTYKICGVDKDNPLESCLAFRETVPVTEGALCKNNILVPDENRGCAYNTNGTLSPAECDISSGFVCNDVRNTDTFNQCVCDKSKYTLATKLEFENNAKKCNGSQPQKVERIGTGTPDGACYQWVNEGDICSGDFICKK